MINTNLLFNISPELKRIMDDFQIKHFNIRDCDLTYRTLNHYQKLNIIDNSKINPSTWRKFSGVELVWIKIILTMRDLGVNLAKIQLLKKNLLDQGSLGSIDRIDSINNSFEHEIALTIKKQYDLYLIIFSDYSYSFHDSQSLKQVHLKRFKKESHINIPLTETINSIYKKIKDNNNNKV
jgi:DNA-binding transcriptional MerR regulator